VTTLEDYGIGYGSNLPLVVHQIVGEHSGETGIPLEHDDEAVINANFDNSGNGVGIPHSLQRALVVFVDRVTVDHGHYGQTCVEPSCTQPAVFAVPADVQEVRIFAKTHLEDLLSGSGYCGVVVGDPPCHAPEQAVRELLRTIGHEIGHGVGICHFNACGPVGDDTPTTRSPTVMGIAPILGPTPEDTGGRYDAFEQGLIRLRRGGVQ
jgi:hypothetical protein